MNLEHTGFLAYTPRQFHSAAYDESRDLMILFGGQGATGLLNDMLIYNFANSEWSQPPSVETDVTSRPSKRAGHAAFVLNGSMLLMGGDLTNFDCWSYNISNNNWSRLQIYGDIPAALYGSSYIFVNQGNRPKVYLFGGYRYSRGGGYSPSRALYEFDIR